MINALNNKWKEFLFAFSGFGPNFLMVLMGAYFTDAINPAALDANQSFQAIASGVCFILPAVFPILFAFGKVFDGIIDIPLAHLTDTLSTKWGRRRPAIAVCIIPMTVSFAMFWLPVGGAEHPLFNTIWIFIWALVFFATYTMCLIAFYGSISTTCINERQRLRVSSYKSFFDTISYCLVYALVPLLLDVFRLHIDELVFICLPMMATMLIPLFLIKEGEKYGYPENEGLAEEKVTFKESIRLTFKNKVFMRWLAVNCCTYFGLQMFLVGMNAMIDGGMGMNGVEMAILNTCAFAPVPIMLYLFNKLKAKKGVRFTYQTCLLAFAVAILSFFFGSLLVTGGNKPIQYIIGCVGGVVGSWAIGAFFMMPYLITSQISSVEEKLTKKNHSAMYFAGNVVATSVVGAISGSLLYEYIKMFFFSTETKGLVWAETATDAAAILGVAEANVFNFGTTIVPFIVAAACLLGFFLAFRMPKEYTPLLVGRELKKQNPDLDISELEAQESAEPQQEKSEIIFVQIGLSILSGFIFGFIWVAYLFRSVKELTGKWKTAAYWALCCFVPFLSTVYMCRMHKQLKEKADELGMDYMKQPWYTIQKAMYITLGIFLLLLPLNVLGLAFLQFNVNKIYEGKAKKEREQTANAELAPANA